MLLYRALAGLLVPVFVIFIIPYWLVNTFPTQPPNLILEVLGSIVFIGGFLLAGWCMLLFFNIGRGTIMPWDPTLSLVAVCPYQYMHNPMISGVLAMLAGEALFFGSVAIGILAVIFFAINHVYFIYSEEPGLEKRFGERYRDYKLNVPRWIPRLPNKP